MSRVVPAAAPRKWFARTGNPRTRGDSERPIRGELIEFRLFCYSGRGRGGGRHPAPAPRPPACSVLGSLFSGSLLGSGGPTVGGFGERLSRLLSTINHLLLITGLLFSIIFTHFIPLSAGLIGRVQRCNLLLH